MLAVEGPLHRVHFPVHPGQALTRGDLAPVRLRGKHRARFHRLPVQQHGARPAGRGVAADVGRCQPGHLTDEVGKQQAVFHIRRDLGSVDPNRYLHWLALTSLIAAHTRSGLAGMSMCRTPRCDTASMTAFCTAGIDPMVPASPIPFTPSGLMVVGVSLATSSNDVSTSAVTAAQSASVLVSGLPSSS